MVDEGVQVDGDFWKFKAGGGGQDVCVNCDLVRRKLHVEMLSVK